MSEVTKNDPVSPLTDLLEWFQSGWPAVADWRREAAHTLRIEDRFEDDRPVVRVEIPGVDSAQEVQVTVSVGVLTISAERASRPREKGRSEYRYGSLPRRASEPPGAPSRSWPRCDGARSRWPTGLARDLVPRGGRAPALPPRVPTRFG